MSTTYGKIKLRDGSDMAVEAFGISGNVKLILTDREIAISDPVQLRTLITLLEIAGDHVWSDW